MIKNASEEERNSAIIKLNTEGCLVLGTETGLYFLVGGKNE